MNAICRSMGRWGRRVLPVIAWALVCSLPPGALAQGTSVQGSITRTDGRVIAGSIRWLASQKSYEVRMASSATPVALIQVANLSVAKPAGLDQAVAAVRAGAAVGSSDVANLGRIAESYLMLEHDLTAMRWMAEAYLKAGKGPEVLDRFNRVMEPRPPEKVPADVARTYWNVLLEAERMTELRAQLTVAIERGPRAQAASAQMLRGEMDMRRKQYRDALLDGFLRTIVLFGDVRDVQPEALYKAAACFDELGESQNAEKMRLKLTQEYPDSPFSK